MPACVHEEQQRGSCGRVLYFLHPSQNRQASSGVTAGFQEKDVLTLPGSAALESHSSGRLTNKLGEQFSNVSSQGPFIFLKIIEDTKNTFVYMGYIYQYLTH